MAENGVKDAELSAKVGVSRVQILRLRLGQNKASLATAHKLAEITRIPAAVFVMGEAA